MLKAVDAFRFNCLCGCKMRLFMLENAAERCLQTVFVAQICLRVLYDIDLQNVMFAHDFCAYFHPKPDNSLSCPFCTLVENQDVSMFPHFASFSFVEQLSLTMSLWKATISRHGVTAGAR